MILKTRRQKNRLLAIICVGGILILALSLLLMALQAQISFFYSPTEFAQVRDKLPPQQSVHIGGLVAAGSVAQEEDNLTVRFIVTDRSHDVDVVYKGLLPDLFREGQGVVVKGFLGGNGVFQAMTLLAKHDETYMPREVAASLKSLGQWSPPPPPAGR